MDMFALLTLPRGVPIDPEASAPSVRDEGEAPVGIIIRPGPSADVARVPLRLTLAAARA
jgi:hypothetical protein